jgi:hypothetical protein
VSRLLDMAVGAFVALTLVTGFDHAMRLEAAEVCESEETVRCPDGPWWWS